MTIPHYRAASLLLVLAAAGFAWMLAAYWAGQPDSLDRLLIPCVAIWLAWRQRDVLRRMPAAPTRWGYLPLLVGVALAPPAWSLYAQVGPMPLLVWWYAVAFVALVAGMTSIRFGAGHLRALAFPLAFACLALPVPKRVELGLQAHLQEWTTRVAAFALPRLGVPTEREGFVLALPSGRLGVVEACSGVRAVTAIVAAAALLAYLRGFRIGRTAVLVALALPTIALANALRVVLNGLAQEWFGLWVNRGVAHELFGAVTLLIGLGGVLALAHLIRPRSTPTTSSVLWDAVPRRPVGARLATGLLAAAAVASIVGYVWGVRQWSDVAVAAPLDEIAQRIGEWKGTGEAIDPEVRTMLGCDAAVHRVYRNAAGQPVHAWAIYWGAAAAVKDYVHHPDVCWPNRGWVVVESDRRPVGRPGCDLEMSVRRFARGGERQLVGYWVQDGRRPWTAEEEVRAAGGWGQRRNPFERLLSEEGRRPTPRLVVLVGADLWDASGYAERSFGEFASQFAAEVYRVCPWADPAGGRPD